MKIKEISLIALAIVLCAAGAARAGVILDDMRRLSQDPAAYMPSDPDARIITEAESNVHASIYLERKYRPWTSPDTEYLGATIDELRSFIRGMGRGRYFDAKGRAVPAATVRDLAASAARIGTGTAPMPAVAVDAAEMRLLPTEARYYSSAASALGQRGLLKQDVLQNSTLKPGDPAAIWGATPDGRWCFVASDSAVGWVQATRVALVRPETAERVMALPHAVTVKDDVKMGGAVIKMGATLPADGAVLMPVRGRGGFAEYRPVEASETFAPFPVPYTARNAVRACSEVIDERYGWGGLDGLRDCSAMTRDFFAVFGVWLPRNSGEQSGTGLAIDTKGTPVASRERLLAERGVPFATLVHVPGHIMLYIGERRGEPIVMHNMWGIRNNPNGKPASRAAVGRTVITTLRAGQEVKGRPVGGLFVERMDQFNIPTVIAGDQ